ncbi:MAG: hypothetical protein GY870_12610 [archaeon]|nr:hypothetical protein [archaeon]
MTNTNVKDVKTWHMADTPMRFHLPCKWLRPIRDVFVGCWNYDKVESIIGKRTSGNLAFDDRDHCRGTMEEIPDCWDGLEQKCINQCEHYFKMDTFKYGKLKGFCTKQCKDFELFKPNEECELLYKDFNTLDILDILKLSKVKE